MTMDITAAARLVSYAAMPRALPARDTVYAELVERHRDDPAFADVVADIAAGLGLELRVDEVAGVVAYADSDGPLRRRLSDIVRSRSGRSASESRVLFALVLLAVARTAFAQPAHLSDRTRIARIDPDVVISYLDRLVEEIGAGAQDAEAGHLEAEEGWRAWSHLREVRASMERHNSQQKAGLIRRVCDMLEDEGHLVRQGNERDGLWWRTTPRFRFAVHTLVCDSLLVGELTSLVSADLFPAGGDSGPGETDPQEFQT
ncbi:MAG: hypothetical protein ACT4OS_07635 [Acidimicrobiales bacterium]